MYCKFCGVISRSPIQEPHGPKFWSVLLIRAHYKSPSRFFVFIELCFDCLWFFGLVIDDVWVPLVGSGFKVSKASVPRGGNIALLGLPHFQKYFNWKTLGCFTRPAANHPVFRYRIRTHNFQDAIVEIGVVSYIAILNKSFFYYLPLLREHHIN